MNPVPLDSRLPGNDDSEVTEQIGREVGVIKGGTLVYSAFETVKTSWRGEHPGTTDVVQVLW